MELDAGTFRLDFVHDDPVVTAAELHSRLSTPHAFECMGLPLVDLTLGHVRVMDHLGCARAKDPSELALAVLVCQQPWRQALPYLRSRLMPFRLWVWRRYLKEWDFAKEAEAFNAYMLHHTELPVITPKNPRSHGRIPIPTHQLLRVVLQHRLGYRPETVDDTPYLQALWDVATLNVIIGTASIMDMDEKALNELGNSIDFEKAAKAFSAAL